MKQESQPCTTFRFAVSRAYIGTAATVIPVCFDIPPVTQTMSWFVAGIMVLNATVYTAKAIQQL